MARTYRIWRTMKMHDIDYKVLEENLDKMINLLEYDSMRSPGKAKLNSQHLQSLYDLKDRYSKFNSKKEK